MRVAWLSLLMLGSVGAAVAQPTLVRLGNHGGFGRVVFEFADDQPFQAERLANAVVLHFPGAGDVPSPEAGAARNVTMVIGGHATATLTLVPGARLRMTRLGSRIVVDALDPVTPETAIRTRNTYADRSICGPAARSAGSGGFARSRGERRHRRRGASRTSVPAIHATEALTSPAVVAAPG